jgi:hypothetical protein
MDAIAIIIGLVGAIFLLGLTALHTGADSREFDLDDYRR